MFANMAQRIVTGGMWIVVVLASVLLLAACGGGGGGSGFAPPQTPAPQTPRTHDIIAFGQVGDGGRVQTTLSVRAVAAADDFVILQPVTVTVQVPYISIVYQFVVTIDKPMTVRRITLEGGRVVPETEAPQTPVVEAPVDETPAPPQDETPPPEPPAQDPPQTPVNNDPPDEGGNPPQNDNPGEGGNPPPDSTPPGEGGNPPTANPPVNNDPPDEGGNPPEDNTPPDEGVTPPPPPPPSVELPPYTPSPVITPPQWARNYYAVWVTVTVNLFGSYTPVLEPKTIYTGPQRGPAVPIITPPVNPPSKLTINKSELPRYDENSGGVAAIKAEAAHSAGYFGQGVTVAVLDARFTLDHEVMDYPVTLSPLWRSELNLLPSGPHERRTDVWAESAESYYAYEGSLQRQAAHIIGAARNSVGIDGIAPSVKILPLNISTGLGPALHPYDGGPRQNYPDYINREGGNYVPDAFRYAISSGVHIIHSPFQDYVRVHGLMMLDGEQKLVKFDTPLRPETSNEELKGRMSVMSDVLDGQDVVAVWDAGDDGWHSGGYMELNGDVPYDRPWITPEYVMSHALYVTSYTNASITLTSANAVSGYGWGPYYERDLLGKWLVAVAVDQNNNNTIASFSNGCGGARAWCLAAPGVRVFNSEIQRGPGWARVLPPIPGPSYIYSNIGNGTPYSAAYVAGALALLKSKYPNMPMSVVAQILLSTATDLGAAGVDDVYGHGMVNVSAALAAQAGSHFVSPDSAQGSFGASSSGGAIPGLPLERGKTQIPNALAGLGSQLREVKMAVRYLNDRYYDAPLDVDIAPRPELSAMRVVDDLWNETSDGGKAGAARFFVRKNDGDQLREAGGALGGFQVRHNWFGDAPVWSDVESSSRPFFFSSSGGRKSEVSWRMGNAGFFASRGEEKTGDYNQYGVRLWKRAGRLHLSSALSEIREEDSLLGGRFGGVLPLAAGGETRQGKVLAKFAMDGFGASDEWHLLGIIPLRSPQAGRKFPPSNRRFPS